MAKQITQEAVDFINEKPLLYVEVAELLGITPSSLATYLIRKRQKLARYDIVVRVASEMGVDPERLIEPVPVKELAKAV